MPGVANLQVGRGFGQRVTGPLNLKRHPKAAAIERRRTEQVRAALVVAGSELDSVPTGHYPHVEMPVVTAERFGGWVGS